MMLREQLDAETFDAAWAEGRTMRMEEASRRRSQRVPRRRYGLDPSTDRSVEEEAHEGDEVQPRYRVGQPLVVFC
jgi:hypothetical protein